jgi:hypothetical protein
MEENLDRIDEWSFRNRPRGRDPGVRPEPYVAGDEDNSIKDRLLNSISPELPTLTSARATLATLLRTQHNVRNGNARTIGIYSKMYLNACAFVEGNLYVAGGSKEESVIQKWTLRTSCVETNAALRLTR